MRTYSISELAREFGVTPRALRFYEDKDLLHPGRDGMNRVYSYRDRGRLKIILQCKRVGFSLAEIREILDVYSLEGHRAQLTLTLKKLKAQIEVLERQRQDIEGTLDAIHEGISWAETKLEETKNADAEAESSARAFDKIARQSLGSELAK